jgi:hypothetical protein
MKFFLQKLAAPSIHAELAELKSTPSISRRQARQDEDHTSIMIQLFLVAAGVLLASYLYTRLTYVRSRQFAHIPQLPNHLLWGHLKSFNEFMTQGIHDRHPGML